MLNRRHLRIKVLQALYAYTQSNNQNYATGEKELLHSIDKMYDLYVLYLQVLPELAHFASVKDEARQKKVSAKSPDAKRTSNLANNQFIALLSSNIMLGQIANKLKQNWVGDVKQDIIMKLFTFTEALQMYTDYAELDNPSFEEDRKFAIALFKKEICNFPALLNFFEEERIHWQDDFDHVFSMVIKTLKTFKQDTDDWLSIMPLYKEDEKVYVKNLFKKCIAHFDTHTKQMDAYTQNWDAERLAKMDILIMNLAITEAKEFSSIPLKVTLNEYIEISKFYSTPKSNTFINGVLDKMFADLQKEGSIRKIGRGLI